MITRKGDTGKISQSTNLGIRTCCPKRSMVCSISCMIFFHTQVADFCPHQHLLAKAISVKSHNQVSSIWNTNESLVSRTCVSSTKQRFFIGFRLSPMTPIRRSVNAFAWKDSLNTMASTGSTIDNRFTSESDDFDMTIALLSSNFFRCYRFANHQCSYIHFPLHLCFGNTA